MSFHASFRSIPSLAGRLRPALILCAMAALLGGCATIGAVGPSERAVVSRTKDTSRELDIKLVQVTGDVAQRVQLSSRPRLFSDVLGNALPTQTVFGRGDAVDIAVWEAPPGVLFTTMPSVAVAGTTVSRAVTLPEQVVDTEGRILVPFAGSIRVDGRTPQEVAREITARLRGKANDPQVVVRRIGNATANVTVVGEVGANVRLPLSPKGERLLDAIATAGGARQPVGKSVVQITRGDQVVALPLDTVIRDPKQNVPLQAGDVVTVLFQPYSFTALGAVAHNAEINFEGTGITLAQALGRVGGLQDNRSDLKGVFVFRLENPAALDPALVASARPLADGRIPVVYRIDMKDPATFFIAQTFPIRDKDVMYVSNAPAADLQKFLNIVSTAVFSVVNIGAVVN